MQLGRKSALALASAALLALGVTACGGSSNSSSDNTSAATPAASSSETVSTKSIGGISNVLVDSKGMALYTNDMDSGSKIACTGQCLSFWLPVAAPSGGQPTSSDSSVQS
jgi:predicted lipoprotein with Yx(FWY)xxD motif